MSPRWEPKNNTQGYRQIAKFYGGKALTGTSKQKEWAEKIRYSVLSSEYLSDEQKIEIIAIGGDIQKSSFWINNRGLKPQDFIASSLLEEIRNTKEVIDSNEKLLFSNIVADFEKAKIDIYERLKSNKFSWVYDFRRSDELYEYGSLRKLRVNNGRLIK